MADRDWLVYAGLGLLAYFVFKPSSAFSYPSITQKPLTTGKPGSTPSGTGFQIGGSPGGSTGSNGGSTGSRTYQTPSGLLINCPCSPDCPDTSQDSGDPCDTASMAYDPQLCNVEQGTDSLIPCDHSSYYYDMNVCQQQQATEDSNNPCDPSSSAYDPYVGSGDTAYYDGGSTTVYDDVEQFSL